MDSAAASRRNGKEASCEPCRKRKIRCDHQRPICGRCQKRKLSKHCFYHPAPLTRRENLSIGPSSADIPMTFENRQPETGVFPDRLLPVATERLPSAANTTNDIPERLTGSHLASSPSSPAVLSMQDTDRHGIHVQAVQKLVTRLRHIPLIHRAMSHYFASTASAIIPGALIMPALEDLQHRWNEAEDTNKLSRSVAERIVLTMANPVDVRSLTGAADFCLRHHGDNLSLEILGLIYTISARACLYDLNFNMKHRDAFVEDMLQCSDDALHLVRGVVPEVTDCLMWLQCENLLLTKALRGDAAPVSWHKLGELASDILALDLHREASYSGLPFFLAQCRRRIFVVTFHYDKLLATLVDRPPRISKRYSDCDMPLDMTNEEMLAEDPFELARYQQNLTSEGWSVEQRYNSSTWARLRFIVARFREEVLEYSFQPSTPESIEHLKGISKRSREQLDSLPPHLRYTPECWDSGLANTICFMLTAVYLTSRQLDFQIFRTLEKSDDAESLSPLLHAARDIVATVLHVGSLRTRASFLAHDFEFLILAYSLPSAAVLATALERSTLPGASRLPASLSRSAVIRSLTVFVSMLESLQGLSGTRKSLCTESIKLISRTLDKVLDAQQDSAYAASVSSGATPDRNYFGHAVVSQHAAGLELLGSNDASYADTNGLELLDLTQWANNMDWANMGTDWMSF